VYRGVNCNIINVCMIEIGITVINNEAEVAGEAVKMGVGWGITEALVGI
jgi:hypothetical protein